MSIMKDYRLLGVTIGAGVLVSFLGVGCGPTTNTALERARANYQQAQQDPQITTYAPAALQEAQQSLQHAEHVWQQEKNDNEVTHLAYVTDQRVAIARFTADKTVAEDQIKQLGEEREHVLLDARTREAERAQREAAAQARDADRARIEAQSAQERAYQLEQELAELQARQTERGLVLTLDDVLFEYDKAELKPGALRKLYPLVTFLKENPERNILIEGHTDSIGSESYNLELSERRAEAVESFLLQNGISSTRVITRGYGKSYPVASNSTEAGRQQNRRVEVVILRQGAVAADSLR
jgi:outer membrane protein OmpA-like peptidoglycan-associated protein